MEKDILKSTVVGNLEVIELTDNRFENENQKTRMIRIWTPTNYDKTKKYPVIYMHDGQNVFDDLTSYAGEWEADELVESLINKGFLGAIVVGIDNTSKRMGEYVYNHDFLDGARFKIDDDYPKKTGDKYMNFIEDIIKPYIDTNYSTYKSREYTTICGSSLGGLISLFGGLEHLNTFGNILAFSTSTRFVNSKEKLNNYFNNLSNLLKDTKYFFYVGTNNDGDITWPSDYKKMLVNNGVKDENIKIVIGKNYTHNEKAWRDHLPLAFEWILKDI